MYALISLSTTADGTLFANTLLSFEQLVLHQYPAANETWVCRTATASRCGAWSFTCRAPPASTTCSVPSHGVSQCTDDCACVCCRDSSTVKEASPGRTAVHAYYDCRLSLSLLLFPNGCTANQTNVCICLRLHSFKRIRRIKSYRYHKVCYESVQRRQRYATAAAVFFFLAGGGTAGGLFH